MTIGSDCYVASRVVFTPGSEVGARVLVTVGAVVNDRLRTNDAVVGGVPAKVLRTHWDWKTRAQTNPSE